MDFIALDVETVNADMSSICALGLVHFKNGQVFKNLSTLINPEDHFAAINISIHGIRPEDVVGKPTMKTVYPALQVNLENCVVVHHGNFDPAAMRRVASHHGFTELDCNWLDSCRVAKSAWPNYANRGYGLDVLAEELCIAFQHHQPAEDARCAGMVVLRAIADTGIALEDWFTVEAPDASAGIGPDGKKQSRVAKYYPTRVATAGDLRGPLHGERVVFTGALSIDRSEAARMAATVGCEVGDSVSKKTTILVVGEQDARFLNGYDRSSKHRKAEQLIRAGAAIRIMTESNFRLLVGCS